MRHALIYVGSFESNFSKLTSTTSEFEGSDGTMHPYPAWPSAVNGLRICYMEKSGKKFVAVRIADDKSDVVLQNEMILLPGQHFGFGVRLSGEPTSVEDDSTILQLLEDIIKKNREHSTELLNMRARFKTATGK